MASTWENIKTVWLYLQLILMLGVLAALLWWIVPKFLTMVFEDAPALVEEAKYKYNNYQDCVEGLRGAGYSRNAAEQWCKENTGWMSE